MGSGLLGVAFHKQVFDDTRESDFRAVQGKHLAGRKFWGILVHRDMKVVTDDPDPKHV
jgi:hypothetical protein